MAYEVLKFIPQAARDCSIRAKDVMEAVSDKLKFPNPKLRLNGKEIAMGMSHYRRHGQPCNGFHELFFNGVMFVLQGIVGANFTELERNVELFTVGQYEVIAKGGKYKLDTLLIERKAGEEMCRLAFDRSNWSTTKIRAGATVDSKEESDGSAMDK